MCEIYWLQGNPIHRIANLLSEADVGNLRVASRGLRDMVPTLDQTERYEREVRDLFAHSTFSSEFASWEDAAGHVYRGLLDSRVSPRPARPGARGPAAPLAARQAATRPPAWMTIDPARVPQMRLGDTLFAVARAEVEFDGPWGARRALDLLNLLPWRAAYIEVLVGDLRRFPSKRAQNFLETSSHYRCVLGAEVGLTVLNVRSWRELTPWARHDFLTHGGRLLSKLPPNFPSSAKLVQLGKSFLSCPPDNCQGDRHSLLRRMKLLMPLINAGYLEREHVENSLRAACVAESHEVINLISAGEDPGRRANVLNVFRAEVNYLRGGIPPH